MEKFKSKKTNTVFNVSTPAIIEQFKKNSEYVEVATKKGRPKADGKNSQEDEINEN